MVKSKDFRRQTKEWIAVVFYMCEKCYRKSCKYMRNNSTRQKGKKINFTIWKFRVQQYEDIWPTMVGKPWREKSGVHADMVSNGFANFIAKGNGLANSRDVNPLETIWIIVDKTTYKDPAPKTLDELREWLRFAWKNVSLDTLWELVHSIPHHLENVRKHKGRHFGY